MTPKERNPFTTPPSESPPPPPNPSTVARPDGTVRLDPTSEPQNHWDHQFANPDHLGEWGGEPEIDPSLLVKEGVAKGSYKQPGKNYITPAAHYVERFGTQNAVNMPYHPYTLAVGLKAVRDYFLSVGLHELEATQLAQASFEMHIKSGELMNVAKGRRAVELSKKGVDIRDVEKPQSMIDLEAMSARGQTQATAPEIDFDALEQAVLPTPEQKKGQEFGTPASRQREGQKRIDAEVIVQKR